MSWKKQLLDPLGTICKLISLNFCEINTKISIQNHILMIQGPNNYQFILRLYNGDGRDNISELYYVIIRIIEWYLIEANKLEYSFLDENGEIDYEPNDQINGSREIHLLIKYLCIGLRKLQETYEYGNVVLAIQFYINLLEDALDGRYDRRRLPKYIINKDQEYKNLLDYEKIRDSWDYVTLQRICNLYENCFKTLEEDDMNENTKYALIDGYLKSIDLMLIITDNRFQNLIKNSSKG